MEWYSYEDSDEERKPLTAKSKPLHVPGHELQLLGLCIISPKRKAKAKARQDAKRHYLGSGRVRPGCTFDYVDKHFLAYRRSLIGESAPTREQQRRNINAILNDDCLMLIFRKFRLATQIRLRIVCRRWAKVISERRLTIGRRCLKHFVGRETYDKYARKLRLYSLAFDDNYRLIKTTGLDDYIFGPMFVEAESVSRLCPRIRRLVTGSWSSFYPEISSVVRKLRPTLESLALVIDDKTDRWVRSNRSTDRALEMREYRLQDLDRQNHNRRPPLDIFPLQFWKEISRSIRLRELEIFFVGSDEENKQYRLIPKLRTEVLVFARLESLTLAGANAGQITRVFRLLSDKIRTLRLFGIDFPIVTLLTNSYHLYHEDSLIIKVVKFRQTQIARLRSAFERNRDKFSRLQTLSLHLSTADEDIHSHDLISLRAAVKYVLPTMRLDHLQHIQLLGDSTSLIDLWRLLSPLSRVSTLEFVLTDFERPILSSNETVSLPQVRKLKLHISCEIATDPASTKFFITYVPKVFPNVTHLSLYCEEDFPRKITRKICDLSPMWRGIIIDRKWPRDSATQMPMLFPLLERFECQNFDIRR